MTGGTNSLLFDCDTGSSAAQCGTHPFELDFTLASYTNTIAGASALVSLEAIAGADGYGVLQNGADVPGEAHATAGVDPNVVIDPVWAAAHPGYAISFSQGVGNGVTGVPEPATWAMMLIGAGFLGTAARRRRLKAF